jgi:hypothetical protein
MNNRPTRDQIKSVPCPSPPDSVHRELIDELDKIRDVRKARNSRDAGLLSMSSRLAIEKIHAVSCPPAVHSRDRSVNFTRGNPAPSRIGIRSRRNKSESVITSSWKAPLSWMPMLAGSRSPLGSQQATKELAFSSSMSDMAIFLKFAISSRKRRTYSRKH